MSRRTKDTRRKKTKKTTNKVDDYVLAERSSLGSADHSDHQ